MSRKNKGTTAKKRSADQLAAEESRQTRRLVTDLRRYDVLLGRGTGPNENNGNRYFRDHVRRLKDDYRLADCRRAKDQFVVEAIDAVTSQGGRFLRKLQKGKASKGIRGRDLYEIADPDTVIEKTRQAFQYCRRQVANNAVTPSPPPAEIKTKSHLSDHDLSSIASSQGTKEAINKSSNELQEKPSQMSLQRQIDTCGTNPKPDTGTRGLKLETQALTSSALGLLGNGFSTASSAVGGRHLIESSVYGRTSAVESALRSLTALSDIEQRDPLRIHQLLASQSHLSGCNPPASLFGSSIGRMPHLLGQDSTLAPFFDPATVNDILRRKGGAGGGLNPLLPPNSLEEAVLAKVRLLAALYPQEQHPYGSSMGHAGSSMFPRQEDPNSLLAKAFLANLH